ncbi:MAG: PaaI family thioesterase [Candidatus Dormibacteraceae bacterium]
MRGSYGDASGLSLSGVERMRRTTRGLVGAPPIHHLTGVKAVEAGFGSSTFAMPVSPWLLTPVPGLITGGIIAFLADGPLGTAIMTLLPPFGYMTTSDLSISFLQPGTMESGTLVGKARVIHGGKSVALSEVMIEDGRGRLLAHGTSRGFLLTAPGAPPAAERSAPPDYPMPDPYLRRPIPGSPVPQEIWDSASGLEILRRCVSDPEAAPPLHHLTGLRPIEALEGRCSFVLPASPWLASPQPIIYGGAIALLADAALAGAVMTINPPGGAFAPLDLKVNFLRPVLPDGGPMTAVATLAHRGRTMVVATAELYNEAGKRIALASSSAMLLPKRPWIDLAGGADPETAAPS